MQKASCEPRALCWVTWLLSAALFGCEASVDEQRVGSVGPPKRVVNTIGMALRRIPAGRGWVGSPPGERHRYEYCVVAFNREIPDSYERRRKVTIRREFYMGETEVTNAQFRSFWPKHRSRLHASDTKVGLLILHSHVPDSAICRLSAVSIDGDDQPATCISWVDAAAFCAWLSSLPAEKAMGRVYRLPTEEEWEYACRAGEGGRFFWGGNERSACKYANFADASGRKMWREGVAGTFPCADGFVVSSPVGSFSANGFGLYDMLGNALEFCEGEFITVEQDPAARMRYGGLYSEPAVAVRGGSWASGMHIGRCAARFALGRKETMYNVGFRVVMEVRGSQ